MTTLDVCVVLCLIPMASRRPLAQRKLHHQLSDFLRARGHDARPIVAFPERLIGNRLTQRAQDKQPEKQVSRILLCV